MIGVAHTPRTRTTNERTMEVEHDYDRALIDGSRHVMIAASMESSSTTSTASSSVSKEALEENTREAVERLRDSVRAAPIDVVRARFIACIVPTLDVLRLRYQALNVALGKPHEDAPPKVVARRRVTAERALETTRAALEKMMGDSIEEDVSVRIFSALVGALSLPRIGAYESVCEEVLLALRAFCASARGAEDSSTTAFQSERLAPMVGFTISTLLAISHEEASAGALGSKSLRSSALLTLERVIHFIGDADALAFFLPGVVSGLTKVLVAGSGIRANEGAGPGGTASDGVEYALISLSSILTLVLNDNLYESHVSGGENKTNKADTLQDALKEIVSRSSREDDEISLQKLQTSVLNDQMSTKDISERSFNVKRDGEWLRNTAPRVETALLATIPPFVSSARSSVRLAAAKLAGQVLQHCSDVLGLKVRRKMLECLLTLSGDSWTQVSMPVLEDLRSLDKLGCINTDDLEILIKDDLSTLADVLRQDSAAAAGHLQRLCTALEFTGPSRLKEILFISPSSRQSLCLNVVQCLVLTSHVSLKERAAKAVHLIDLGDASASTDTLPREPPRLQYFPESSMYTKFATILRILGQATIAESDVLVEPQLVPIAQFFLGALRDGSEADHTGDALVMAGAWQRNATAHVIALNEITHGVLIANHIDRKYLTQMCGLILEEYVCSEVWELDALNPDNASLLRAIMEGLGVIGQGLGTDYIRTSSFLTSALCPLLDRLGENSAEVRDTAALVLTSIAICGEYASAADDSPIGRLVVENGDYVVDMLSRHIRHLDQHPRTSQLFAAVLRRTNAARSMVRLLAEPIRSALRTLSITSRNRYQDHSRNFLLVTREYCRAIVGEVESICTKSKSVVGAVQKYHPEEPDSDDELTEIFVDELSSSLSEDIEGTRTNCISRARLLQSMVVSSLEILETIGGLLESPDAGVRSLAARSCALVMQSLGKAESALKDEKYTLKVLQSYNGLDSIPFDLTSLHKEARVLPHVHDMWPHVVSSLSDKNRISIQPEPFEATLQLLTTMAIVSGGEFIAKRMHTDLWPFLARVLEHGVRHVDLQTRSLDSLTIADTIDTGLLRTSEISPELTKSIRILILKALTLIASDNSSKDALRDLVTPAIPIVSKLATSHISSTEVQEAAKKSLASFANVNADELWLHLMLLTACSGEVYTISPPTCAGGRCSLPTIEELLPSCGSSPDKRAVIEGEFARDLLKSLAL